MKSNDPATVQVSGFVIRCHGSRNAGNRQLASLFVKYRCERCQTNVKEFINYLNNDKDSATARKGKANVNEEGAKPNDAALTRKCQCKDEFSRHWKPYFTVKLEIHLFEDAHNVPAAMDPSDSLNTGSAMQEDSTFNDSKSEKYTSGRILEGIVFDDDARQLFGIDAEEYMQHRKSIPNLENILESTLISQLVFITLRPGTQEGDLIFKDLKLPFLFPQPEICFTIFHLLGIVGKSLSKMETAATPTSPPSKDLQHFQEEGQRKRKKL